MTKVTYPARVEVLKTLIRTWNQPKVDPGWDFFGQIIPDLPNLAPLLAKLLDTPIQYVILMVRKSCILFNRNSDF
jgi:hypothetical protein